MQNLFAQSSFFINPSIFYTDGNYSDKTTSKSFTGYCSISWNGYDYVIIGYDNFNIAGEDWNYKQNNFVGGLIYYFENFYWKLNFLFIRGNFKSDNYLPYADDSNVYNIDIIKPDWPFYYGAGYTLFNQTGEPSIKSHQINSRFEYIPDYRVLIGLRGTATLTSDNRKLFSISAKLNYLPFDNFLLKGSIALGERTLFLDPDLLVMFNQTLTQKAHYGIQAEYSPFQFATIVLSFQHSKFLSYDINYLIGGLKFRLEI